MGDTNLHYERRLTFVTFADVDKNARKRWLTSIATGRMSPNFYYYDNSRNESEIVCTPAIQKIEPYTGALPGDPNYVNPLHQGGATSKAAEV
jgi:hypothetical protein